MNTTIDYASETVNYFSNSIDSEEFCLRCGLEYTSARCETLALAQKDWDNAECDDEWATAEQDEKLDAIIENTWNDLQ